MSDERESRELRETWEAMERSKQSKETARAIEEHRTELLRTLPQEIESLLLCGFAPLAVGKLIELIGLISPDCWGAWSKQQLETLDGTTDAIRLEMDATCYAQAVKVARRALTEAAAKEGKQLQKRLRAVQQVENCLQGALSAVEELQKFSSLLED